MVSKEAKELFRISCFPGLQFRPHEISNQQPGMGTRLTAVDFFHAYSAASAASKISWQKVNHAISNIAALYLKVSFIKDELCATKELSRFQSITQHYFRPKYCLKQPCEY